MSQRIVVDENEPVVDVAEAPFEFRSINIRKDKSFTEEFKIIDFLGRGKFGEVKRCEETTTGREFAAKFICTPRPQDRQDVEQEVNVMRKLRHRRLVQLYDAFEAKKEMCLVLEIVYGGELFDRVVSDDFVLTEKACICLVRQICEGVDYIHSKNIIHLDLKPENILCLTKSGNRVKIIDFGLAREFDPKRDTRVMFGTPEFMAPEVVQYDPIDFSTDMWSIGVICYVLLSGLSPFMGDTDVETLSNVSKGKYDFSFSEFEKVSAAAKDFISKLLVTEKKKRITAKQCLEHAWLQKISENLSVTIDKTHLKHFICRRRWQKAINVIVALRRMGWSMKTLQNSRAHNHVIESNDRKNKSWSSWNKSAEPMRKGLEPQIRTKGIAKVKVTDMESTKNRTKVNHPLKVDPVPISDKTTIIPSSIAESNSSTVQPISPSSDKPEQKKKCRKVVEHTTPGNGHVFNLAKVVSYKPRGIRPEFTPSAEAEICGTSGGEKSNTEVNKGQAPGTVTEVSSSKPANESNSAAVEKQPRRKNLMIREKIRFFNQVEEPQVPVKKGQLVIKDRET